MSAIPSFDADEESNVNEQLKKDNRFLHRAGLTLLLASIGILAANQSCRYNAGLHDGGRLALEFCSQYACPMSGSTPDSVATRRGQAYDVLVKGETPPQDFDYLGSEETERLLRQRNQILGK